MHNKLEYTWIFLIWTLLITILNLIDNGYCLSCESYNTSTTCDANLLGLCTWKGNTCVCTSTVAQDIVILMDASGSVQSSGWQIEKDFVESLIATGIPDASRVGLVRFASDSDIIYNLTSSQNKTDIIAALQATSWTKGYTHMKHAIEDALIIFTTQSDLNTHDRLMVLITDGNPVPDAQSPCNHTTRLAANSIETIIIGVGTSWTPAKIDCIVDDPDNDIISVESFDMNAFDAVRELTDSFLCPQAVNIKLSEVKPEKGSEHPVTFIELYNDGVDLDLSQLNMSLTGLFEGYINPNDIFFTRPNTDIIWEADTYLVLFDNSNDIIVDPQCYQCFCNMTSNNLCYDAIYIGCKSNGTSCKYNNIINGQAVSVTYWYQSAGAYEYTGVPIIFNISYDSTSSWPLAPVGYTYEVSDIKTCSATYGYCWGISCSYYGTPGDEPINSCNVSCSQTICSINGDITSSCNLLTDSCDCNSTNHYYVSSSGNTCEYLETPFNCSVYINKTQSLSTEINIIDHGFVQWNRVDVSSYIIQYQVIWYDALTSYEKQIFKTFPNTRFASLQGLAHNGYDTYVAALLYIDGQSIYSEYTQCIEITNEPTVSPTPSPTYAIPPIDHCNISIISPSDYSYSRIEIKWTKADSSDLLYTYNNDQFHNDYKLYYFYNDSTYPSETSRIDNDTFLQKNLPIYINNLYKDVLIYVSAIIADIDTGDDLTELDDQMLAQATLCVISSSAPTPAPTNDPTPTPTNQPTRGPTYHPTSSPTYSPWVLENCIVEITNQISTNWIITWDEIQNTNTPDDRRIYLFINGQQNLIFDENTFSPKTLTGTEINKFTSNISIIVYQEISSTESALLYDTEEDCIIITQSPTNSPTNIPTNSPTTPNPTPAPTTDPTPGPSPSPTYLYVIEWCDVLINSDTQIELTFEIPDFDYPNTPADADDIKYRFMIIDELNNEIKWTDIFLPSNPNDEGATVIRTIDISDSGYIANEYNDEINGFTFELTIIWSGIASESNTFTSYYQECNIKTNSPTNSPSIDPTNAPTNSPTFHPPGIYLTGDIICQGIDRCDDCNNYISDFTCTNENNGLITDDAAVFEEAVTALQSFKLKRYPITYNEDLLIYYTFKIPDTAINSGSDRSDIDPWNGTIEMNKEISTVWIDIHFILESSELDDASEQFEFWLTGCELINKSENYWQECSIIYPYMTPVTISNKETKTTNIFEEFGTIPDWVWPLIVAGVGAFGIASWVFYNQCKVAKMKEEANMQDIQNASLITGQAPADMANDTVSINPSFNA